MPGNAERAQPNRPDLKRFACFRLYDSAFSETLQERQKLVTGPVASKLAFERISFCQGLLFEREVRMEINLRSLHGFMAQPQCDDLTINPVLQQIHGGAVAEHMRGDALVFE